MERRKPSAFLIGEDLQGSSLLASMGRRGYECCIAKSCRETFAFLRNGEFDLVLGPTRLRDGSLYSIMSLLEGSGTTMFYSYPVEQGCWWLPALLRGQKCFGSPALHGSEFFILLDGVMKEIQRDTLATAERQRLLILPARAPLARAWPPTIERVNRLERVKSTAVG